MKNRWCDSWVVDRLALCRAIDCADCRMGAAEGSVLSAIGAAGAGAGADDGAGAGAGAGNDDGARAGTGVGATADDGTGTTCDELLRARVRVLVCAAAFPTTPS